ncbi:hypothetical protein LAZ67_9003204, partial [Cordylochernes scorpioides]
MILANRRITVREVAEDLNISIGSCHSIFINDLGMRRVAAKFVPKLLNCDQKQHRMNIANEMLDSVRDDPNLLQRVITGDEAWVYGYDVETKAQSSQWKLPHEPRPKKARQVRSNVKVLLTVFFDCRGVVHHEFLPQGRTVNKEYYLQVMCNLREAIRQKRSDLWKNKNWLLHHDNAPAHTSLLSPYSPELAPCDFFLFPKLKRPMKRRRYATLDEIKTASKEELKNIFLNDFLKCFEDWKNRWHKCIISHGDYFEGNKIDDIVLLGESKINLQKKINVLRKYFEDNFLTLNQSKSKVMVFRNGGRKARSDVWFWGQLPLTITSKYTYLGYQLTASNSTQQAAKHFKNKALNAINAVWAILTKTRINSIRSSLKLLDSMALSTLLYAAPIWANNQKNLVDRTNVLIKALCVCYDVETKAQSSQWKLPHEPRPKKARQVRSNVKVLLTVFFDCRGVVHHEFLPQGRTVNKEYYLQVMRNLREAIRQKRPDLWKNKNWLFHHDNAPAHTSLLVHDFLAKNNTLMMPQPPYSPDLAPCDFFLFPKLKRPMKGRRYATLDEIKTASKEELKKIFLNDFLKCFEDWKNRWHKCIISHGDYFKGDKIVLKSSDLTEILSKILRELREIELSLLRSDMVYSIEGKWKLVLHTQLQKELQLWHPSYKKSPSQPL